MKKTFSLFFALMLVLASVPVLAANEYTNGLFTYELKKNGTAVITHYDWENSEGDVIIPAQIDGYSVVEIGDYAFYPEDSGGIGFINSEALVTIPDSVVSIGKCAFFMSLIKSVNISNNVQSIGDGAFSLASSVNDSLQFRIDSKQPYFAVIDGCLYNKKEKKLICGAGWNIADKGIPEGILEIGDYAFMNQLLFWHRNILPSTITKIGEYAFYHSSEYDLYIPEGTTIIGEHAFDGFDGDIHFGTTKIRQFPDYALNTTDYRELQKTDIEINNPQDIESIGSYNGILGQAFIDASCFSPSITTIPTGLNPVTKELPDTIDTIESKAFIDIVSDFILPSSITSIADDAFPVGSTFIVESGSYAERWAGENGFACTIDGEDNLDWLNR